MSELIEMPYGTIKIKPCRCGNKYPTLECTTINSKYSLYFFHCKNCKYIADVSFSKKEAVEAWNMRSNN